MTKKKPMQPWVAKLLAEDPNHFRDLAFKSQKSWRDNGKTPRGYATNIPLAKASGEKGRETKRLNREKSI